MYCARGVHKSIIQAYPDTDISIHVVWVPMLGSDNEAAARKIRSMFDDPRVHQYWDPNRLSGTAFTRDVFPNMFRDMAASIPDDHPMAARLKPTLMKRASVPPEKAPLWDAAFFYDGKAHWGDRPPKPAEWIKQIVYYGGRSDGVTGMFWLDDFAKPPVDSDWHVVLGEALKQVLKIDSQETGRKRAAGRTDTPRAATPDSSASGAGKVVMVTSLGESLTPLKERFNAEKDKLRLVALLSPT